MLNTKRRLPQFDSLEGKVLLSAGMADPATTKHHDTAKRIRHDWIAIRTSQRFPGRRWIYRDILSRRGSSGLNGNCPRLVQPGGLVHSDR